MPGLTIDWASLELAFESHAPDERRWLDRSTGEIRSDVDERDPRFLRIEPIPSREQYRMMERFIATVTNAALKEALQDAIVGKGAFRRFKDAVGRFPEERKRWFTFRDALLHRYILDWLKAAKIELREMPAWNLELPMTPSPEPAAQLSPATSSSGTPREGEPAAHAIDERDEAEALKTYLLAWARAHGEEYRYLFGPAAFERLAADLGQEFIIYRKRNHQA